MSPRPNKVRKRQERFYSIDDHEEATGTTNLKSYGEALLEKYGDAHTAIRKASGGAHRAVDTPEEQAADPYISVFGRFTDDGDLVALPGGVWNATYFDRSLFAFAVWGLKWVGAIEDLNA